MPRVYPESAFCCNPPPPLQCTNENENDNEEDEQEFESEYTTSKRPSGDEKEAVINFEEFTEEKSQDTLIRPPVEAHSVEVDRAAKSSFIQCDLIACLILIALITSSLILALAIYCFLEDTHWNGIVRRYNSFPAIPGDSFFAGKYLYLYEDGNRHLQIAKRYLLRGDRWLEMIHMVFFGAFILMTLFQLGCYLTRGASNHSLIIIGYFSVFAGLGFIIAFFPYLALTGNRDGYQRSLLKLTQFADHLLNNPNSGSEYGITEATGKDALTLAGIMKHCYDFSSEVWAIDESANFIILFKKRYTMKELQTLGFCTHHKFKYFNMLMGIGFAIVCFMIPCFHCFFGSTAEEKMLQKKKKAAERATTIPSGQQQPTSNAHPRRVKYEAKPKRESHLKKEDMHKFQHFVEAGSDDDKGMF